MRDISLLSGVFADFEIPKEKRYLLKYFKGKIQRAFLRYYITFGNVWNFTDHTGFYCTRRFTFILSSRYNRITDLYNRSKLALTEEGMAMVNKIESGKLRLTHLPKS